MDGIIQPVWIDGGRDFTDSINAIAELEKLLSCNSCRNLMEKPITLWSCDHIFCENCVHGADKCPVCCLPAWPEDQRENKAITNIGHLCRSLREILQTYMQETKHLAGENEPHVTPRMLRKESDKAQKPIRRSKMRMAPKKSFLELPEDSDETWNDDNVSKAPVKELDYSSVEIVTPKPAKRRKNQRERMLRDVSNKKKFRFATPSPAKGKRPTKILVATTPRNSARRLSSPRGSPMCKTPKSTKKNKRGETPLHIAAIKGDLESIQKLISEGGDVNAKDHAGWTPLHEACNLGHLHIAGALLDGGAFVNMPGYDNETPLMDATRNNHSDIVKLLVEWGADVSLRNINGHTAISMTQQEDIKSLLNQLSSVKDAKPIESQIEEDIPDLAPEEIIISHSSSVSRDQVEKCSETLNATINSSNALTATHLIVSSSIHGRCPRTLKYLQAVARGAFIVQCDWIAACNEAGSWVNERSFEISASNEDLMTGGPKRSRMNRFSQYPGIFDGCHFYLSGKFKPPSPRKEQLSEIIHLAGGVLLTREPKPDSDSVQSCTKVPYHAQFDALRHFYTYYIVYDSTQGKPARMVRRGKVCTVPARWVLDCISQFFLGEISE